MIKYYLPKLLVIWNTVEVSLTYNRNLLSENPSVLSAVKYLSAVGIRPHLVLGPTCQKLILALKVLKQGVFKGTLNNIIVS